MQVLPREFLGGARGVGAGLLQRFGEKQFFQQLGLVETRRVALQQCEAREQGVLLVQFRRVLECEQRTHVKRSAAVEDDDAFAGAIGPDQQIRL